MGFDEGLGNNGGQSNADGQTVDGWVVGDGHSYQGMEWMTRSGRSGCNWAARRRGSVGGRARKACWQHGGGNGDGAPSNSSGAVGFLEQQRNKGKRKKKKNKKTEREGLQKKGEEGEREGEEEEGRSPPGKGGKKGLLGKPKRVQFIIQSCVDCHPQKEFLYRKAKKKNVANEFTREEGKEEKKETK